MCKCDVTKWTAICLILICVLTFSGCVSTHDSDVPVPEIPLDNENSVKEETLYRDAIQLYYDKFIKGTRENATIDDVKVDKHFGVYGDCLVIALYDYGAYYIDVLVSETVNGLTFIYPNGHNILVYHDGEFLSLKNAFECKLLTTADLHMIYNLCD